MEKLASNSRELSSMNQIAPRSEPKKEREAGNAAYTRRPSLASEIEYRKISRDGDTLEISTDGEQHATDMSCFTFLRGS